MSDQKRELAAGKKPQAKPWVKPEIKDLPRLTDLTLQSIPGEGGPGGGSVVIP